MRCSSPSAHSHTTPPTLTNFVDPSVYVGKPYASDIHVYLQDDYVLGEANGTIRHHPLGSAMEIVLPREL